MESKKVTLALYRNIEFGFDCFHKAEEDMDSGIGYAKLSENVEVEFKLLPKETVINSQVLALKEQRKARQAECEAELQSIDRKIGELLALPSL